MATVQTLADYGSVQSAELMAAGIRIAAFDAASILQTGVSRMVPGPRAQNTGTLQQNLADLGTAFDLTEVAEGGAIPYAAPTYTSFTITPGLLGIGYGQTALARFINAYGQLDIVQVSRLFAQGLSNKVTSRIAALSSGFSQSAGSTGVDLSVTTLLAAGTTLELQSYQGEFTAILHGQQRADFRTSLRSETGAIPLQPPTQEQVTRYGSGFVGMWGPFRLFVSSRVPTANAGADRLGMVCADGAFAHQLSAPDLLPDELGAIEEGGMLKVSYESDVRRQEGGVFASTAFGVSETEDVLGVGLLSDA